LNTNYPTQKEKVLVNLVEETGKESVLANGFLDLVKDFNDESITYIQFDFHEHWYIYIFKLKRWHRKLFFFYKILQNFMFAK
jgi:hypothetical protein